MENWYDEALRVFALRLRCLLSERKMAQVDLAKRLKLGDASVNVYVQAKTFPTVKRLIEIAQIFNVSVDYLCGRTDERELNKGVTKVDREEIRDREEKP